MAVTSRMPTITTSEIIYFFSSREIIPLALIEQLSKESVDDLSPQRLMDLLLKRGWITEFQQSQILSGQGSKLIFGPYRLVKPLGEGGMGKVFKAWHSRLDRLVALKFMLPDQKENHAKAISRFHREARAIAQLHHPNVVLLYDADEIDETPYIAMEFVNGESLYEMVRRSGMLGINQSCEYMRQAALGLQHAFECGLVHRDIKPSNLVVAQKKTSAASPTPKRFALTTIRDRERAKEAVADGRLDTIKILDMGLALLQDSLQGSRDNQTALTEMGTVLGTPDFVAPEQARDARSVDIRADLYSLGCTFYFVLSGQVPFPGGSAVEKMLKHQLDLPESLYAVRPDIPAAVIAIVEKLMAKKPDDRYQTPQELADALTACLTQAAPEKTEKRSAHGHVATSTPSQATRATVILSEPQDKQSAPTKKLAVENSPARGSETEAPPKSPAPGLFDTKISLDEVDLGKAHPNPETEIAAPEAKSTEADVPSEIPPAWKLKGHAGMVNAAAVSADGMFAATADVNGAIQIWDLQRNSPRRADNALNQTEVQALAFAVNDCHLLFCGVMIRGRAAIVQWDWRGDDATEWGSLSASDQSGIGCLRFSPDGTVLAAGVGPQAFTWQFKNASSATKPTMHKDQGSPLRALAVSPDNVLLAASGQDQFIRFWGLGKRDRKEALQGRSHAASILSLDFSPDGKLLAMAGIDPRIALWRMGQSTNQKVTLLEGHTSDLMLVQFTPDGSRLVSVGTDGTVLFWNVQTGEVAMELKLAMRLAYRVALSPDAKRLVAGFSDGSVALFHLQPRNGVTSTLEQKQQK